jgi:hypothetical protein
MAVFSVEESKRLFQIKFSEKFKQKLVNVDVG